MGLTQEQIDFLDRCTLIQKNSIYDFRSDSKWTLNEEGLVDIDGDFDVDWSGQKIQDFKGIRFGKIRGNFYCVENELTTLDGGPQVVEGNFYCYNNQLTSLEGGPKRVGGSFICHTNQLTSLEGCPQEIGENFSCRYNKLVSLEGCPQRLGGQFHSDFLVYGRWEIDVWIDIIRNKKIGWEEIGKFFNEEDLQTQIDEDPDKMTIELSPYRKELKELFPNLKFPDTHQEDLDMFGDLSDLGF